MKGSIRSTLLLACAAALPGLGLAAPATYVIDAGHTAVHWEARHQGTSTNRGRFDTESGSIVLDPAAGTGKIEVTVDLNSISTGIPNFDQHLRSADFFDAANGGGKAVFSGERLSFDGEQLAKVEGTLSMLGKTAPLTLTATRYGCYEGRGGKQVCGGDFEATLKRSLWGMEYGLPNIPDDIRLLIQVEAARQ